MRITKFGYKPDVRFSNRVNKVVILPAKKTNLDVYFLLRPAVSTNLVGTYSEIIF